jgi:hypothetical protein
MNSFFGKISTTTLSNPASNVHQLKSTEAKILVKGKSMDYHRKDEIFELKGPTDKDYSSENCLL